MQQQIQQLQQQSKQTDIIQKTLNDLHGFGLIKADANGDMQPVQSFDEMQQNLQIRQQEAMVASQHEQRQANEIQLSNDPSEMRASNQLELIDDGSVPMEDEEVSETHSVIQTRKAGRPRKNQ